MALSPFTVVQDVAGPPAGQRVVDVGCGDGALVEALAKAGYVAEGVEPGADAIALARRRAPHLSFQQSGAEQLPLGDGCFDVVAMVNSLHHVPPPLMQRAIAETRRVLKPAGLFVVIEPGVTGSFFEALRSIEDETEVRLLAQRALDAAVESGAWTVVKAFGFDREERFAEVGDFIARVVAVDPARAVAVERNRPAVVQTFNRCALRETGGALVLVQPNLVRVLVPA